MTNEYITKQQAIDLVKSMEVLIGCTGVSVLTKGIEGLEGRQEWISVKDRLPKEGEGTVLVYGSRGGIYTAYLERIGKYPRWHKLNSKSHYCDPTHWMPLPEPPKE